MAVIGGVCLRGRRILCLIHKEQIRNRRNSQETVVGDTILKCSDRLHQRCLDSSLDVGVCLYSVDGMRLTTGPEVPNLPTQGRSASTTWHTCFYTIRHRVFVIAQSLEGSC